MAGSGPGTLYGAVARLERLELIEPTTNGNGRRAYRLTEHGAAAQLVARGGVAVMSRLVRLYPRAWRDRYEEEFLTLLAERPPTFADLVDTFAARSTPT